MRPPPLVETLDAGRGRGPESLWPAFAARPGCVYLDTALPGPRARFSILACEPSLVLRSGHETVNVSHADGRIENRAVQDPLDAIRELLEDRACEALPGLPFAGGAIGWLGYESGAVREGVTLPPSPGSPTLPTACFGFYDAALVYDHTTSRIHLLAREPSALARLRALVSQPTSPAWCHAPGDTAVGVQPDLGAADFATAVARIRAYIAAGDVYQVNFTHRFTSPFAGPAAALYARLRSLSPAPHSAYLDFGDHQIVSSTPERLLRIHRGRLETRPIKGTIARLADPAADDAQRARLLASAKDQAELLMIVDLARNDLGRVAAPGSVRVEARHELEIYATVHHLVATISAQLAPGRDRFDAIRALHPGGSITGAPKIRAMQIIAELEPEPRQAYTGALGYLGDDGDVDLAIAIRTITCANGLATYHVGAGITWDSDPKAEHEETLQKGRAMRRALDGGA
jgi:para-aminobenzoate synthetase component 1